MAWVCAIILLVHRLLRGKHEKILILTGASSAPSTIKLFDVFGLSAKDFKHINRKIDKICNKNNA